MAVLDEIEDHFRVEEIAAGERAQMLGETCHFTSDERRGARRARGNGARHGQRRRRGRGARRGTCAGGGRAARGRVGRR